MDKLISSLLCCSVSSKDDSNDKYHAKSLNNETKQKKSKNGNQKSSRNSSRKDVNKKLNSSKTSSEVEVLPEENKPNNEVKQQQQQQKQQVNGQVNNKKRNSKLINNSKIELLDDENSINETDTITNTNEESNNNTPNSISNNQGNDSKEVITHQESPKDDDKQIPNINEDKLIYDVDKNVVDSNDIQHKHLIEDEEDEEDEIDEELPENDVDESYLDLTKLQEGQAFNPESGWLLGLKNEKIFGNKKCLILDLDETLVHSSFKYLRTADFVIPVEIENQVHHVYVIKRPGVDEFLRKVGKWYEVVVFTASVSKYGDPLLDKLDIHQSVHHRLFRDSCYNYQGNFIKNLSQIGRPLADSIIIDNSPASYIFHPQHSIPISSWFSDTHDNELLDLLPFLEDIAKPNVDDVGLVLDITI